MKGWTKKTIGEICDAGGGEVKTGPFGSQLHQSDYQIEGTPVVMPADIMEGKIDISRIARVSENHVVRLNKHMLSAGDIVYGRRGDIGRQAIIRDENIGWLCGTGCLRITLGDSSVIPEFLHLYLMMQEIIGWIQNQAIGATMPNLNTHILRRVPVYFPESKDLQRKIVSIICSYDDLIENNKRRIALLEKMAEEIYREWFVRMRFPGHANAKFEKGVPIAWDFTIIEDAFEFMGGGTPSKTVSRYWDEGRVNWYTPSDITASSGIFLAKSGDQSTEEGVASSSARMFPPYSIMMTSRATIGAIGINTTIACTNQGFITCIPNEKFSLTYLYHWLKLNKTYFELLSGGATFAELIKSTFRKIEILSPPDALIKDFNSLTLSLFKKIEILLKQINLAETTRNTLLGRLISGKLSVENLDIRFPPSMQDQP